MLFVRLASMVLTFMHIAVLLFCFENFMHEICPGELQYEIFGAHDVLLDELMTWMLVFLI